MEVERGLVITGWRPGFRVVPLVFAHDKIAYRAERFRLRGVVIFKRKVEPVECRSGGIPIGLGAKIEVADF